MRSVILTVLRESKNHDSTSLRTFPFIFSPFLFPSVFSSPYVISMPFPSLPPGVKGCMYRALGSMAGGKRRRERETEREREGEGKGREESRKEIQPVPFLSKTPSFTSVGVGMSVTRRHSGPHSLIPRTSPHPPKPAQLPQKSGRDAGPNRRRQPKPTIPSCGMDRLVSIFTRWSQPARDNKKK